MKRRFTHLRLFAAAFLNLMAGISASAQTYQWKSLPMGAGGFVSGIIASRQQPNLMYCRTDVGGAYRWDAPNSTWIPLQDWANATQSGFYGVESLAIDPKAPNKLYMLVGINYFDNGKSAILKSDDYGQTFTTIDVTNQFKAHGNGMGRSNGERLQVDPNLGTILYTGTRANGLFKSTDAGLTWNRLAGLNVTTTPNSNGVNFVVIDSTSGSNGVASQKLFVGVSRYDTVGTNLYMSTDAGASFVPVTGGPTGFMPQKAKLLGNGDMIINYANGAGPNGTTYTGSNEPMNNGSIWKYSTTTGTWTNITPSGISRAWGGISIDPANPARMVASTINNYQLQYGPATGGAYGDRIYLTNDGGATWRDVVSPGFTLNNNGIPWITGQAIHWAGTVEFDPFNTSKVWITSGNGIFSNNTIDVVSSPWKFDVKGLEELVPQALVSTPGNPLFTVVSDYDGFRFTNLDQYGQRLTPAMGTTTGLVSAGLNANYLARVGSKIYYSTDQGANWTATAVINGSQGRVALTADGSTMLHCPNGSSTIYYSNNNGATWAGALNGAGPSLFGLSSAVPVADMVNPAKVYVYNPGSGNFSISTSGGSSFSVVQGIGANGSKLMRAIPGLEGHIWVALGSLGLKRTQNSGTTFTTISGVTACSAVGYGKAAPGAIYLTLYIWGTVGGVTGLFRSVDEGATWVRINDDAHQFGGPGNAQMVMGDMNTYGIVYMSTVGRGMVIGRPEEMLPVSLASLSVREAEQAGNHSALLTWKTLTENNAGRFDIERSTDARSWTTPGSVNTKAVNGNSTSILNYEYADDLAGLSGVVYYRLKAVDRNGGYVYSHTVSLIIGKPVKGLTVTVSPNPVEATMGAVVRFTSEKSERVILKVTAANGALVASRKAELPAGSTSLTLAELIHQPSGMYILNIISASTNKRVGTVRFIIPKN